LCVDDEYPGHRLAFRHSIQRKTGNGALIMSDQYPALIGRPLQNPPIVGLQQSYVLNADQIDGRQSANQAAHYMVVEVLVTEQPEQSASR